MKKTNLRQLFRWAFDAGDEHKDLEVMAKVRLFTGLNNTLLRKLLIDLFEKEYDAGEIIFSEGDSGKALYIVMSGSVDIVKKADTGSKVLASLGPGSYFGEMALISDAPRFASAVAVGEKTNLLIMYKSYFDSLIKVNSRISSRVLMNLAESLSGYIRSGNS